MHHLSKRDRCSQKEGFSLVSAVHDDSSKPKTFQFRSHVACVSNPGKIKIDKTSEDLDWLRDHMEMQTVMEVVRKASETVHQVYSNANTDPIDSAKGEFVNDP